jgi:hypothetical protein
LTPEGFCPTIAPIQYVREASERFHIVRLEGTAGLALTNAEALAFAAQLPEVRALVEAARVTLARMDKIDGGGGFDMYDSDKCRKELRATLAKFKVPE